MYRGAIATRLGSHNTYVYLCSKTYIWTAANEVAVDLAHKTQRRPRLPPPLEENEMETMSYLRVIC